MPAITLLDRRFKWRSHGDVQAIWRAHGWKPTTEAERQARKQGIRVVPKLNVHRATLTSGSDE